MPALTFLIALLIVVLGYIAWTLSNYRNESQQNANEIKSYTERYIRERCTGLDVAEGIKCITDARRAASNEERNEADLYAQRQMAVWALAVAVAGFISIPLSIAGIYFVRSTLSEMQQQRVIGQNAVEATLESNRIAQAQLRSNLICDSGHFKLDDIGMHVRIRLNNTGQTPTNAALIVANVHGPQISGKPAKTEDQVGSHQTIDRGKNADLTVLFRSELFGDEWFKILRDVRIMFAITARIEWTDIFGNSWESLAQLFPVNRGPTSGNLEMVSQAPANLIITSKNKPK
jgi:hypothetical protein